MDLLEGIETRRSVRAFKSIPIPEETVKRVLKAASNSPSYSNTQPWEVAVVSGEKRDELSKILCDLEKSGAAPNPDLAFPKTWPPELDKRAKEHNARRFRVLGIEQADKGERKKMRLLNFEFYGAPCILFLFIDNSLTPWSIFDMGLLAKSIILAAYSFGLATCLQAVVASYPDAIREFLKIPKTKQLILGISIGYPDVDAKINAYRSEKVIIDQFVQWYS